MTPEQKDALTNKLLPKMRSPKAMLYELRDAIHTVALLTAILSRSEKHLDEGVLLAEGNIGKAARAMWASVELHQLRAEVFAQPGFMDELRALKPEDVP